MGRFHRNHLDRLNSMKRTDYLCCPVAGCPSASKPTYSTARSLSTHISKKHPEQRKDQGTFECPTCGESLFQAMKLVDHLWSNHNEKVDIQLYNFRSMSQFQEMLRNQEFEQYRVFKNANPNAGFPRRSVYECRRSSSRKAVSGSDATGSRVQGALRVSMDKKCLSRVFIQEEANGEVSAKWIHTHTFHGVTDECEFVFKSLSTATQKDIFAQYQMGVEPSKIIENLRCGTSDFRSREGDRNVSVELTELLFSVL